MNTSTMFLNELTVVDHAFIDGRGMIVGGSFNPSFIVTGNIDPQEQVVVDFSTIKKNIKEIIDDRDTGFDHKLWVSPNFSSIVSFDEYEEHVRITTPHIEVELPQNAVRIFEFENYQTDIGVWFALQVENQLRKRYPSIEVDCKNTTNPHLIRWVENDGCIITDPIPIRYYHGLKNSTSFGCANIAHGHLSFLQFETSDPEKTAELGIKIHGEWSDMLYIYRENLIGNEIKYDTPHRGKFSLKFSDDVRRKIFEHETTIENLVASLKADYYDEFVAAGVKKIYFSEGLSKGAVIDI